MIEELTGFKATAVSRIAAQHDEIVRLRKAQPAGTVAEMSRWRATQRP